ncbi:hypothetical protein AMECASPLE_026730 [Ameca splendens]|uniref:Uncharacterized protein n=1 Tax=Ameca splendens TaxID=208324 RepID=A0ABV0XU02_9TELE
MLCTMPELGFWSGSHWWEPNLDPETDQRTMPWHAYNCRSQHDFFRTLERFTCSVNVVLSIPKAERAGRSSADLIRRSSKGKTHESENQKTKDLKISWHCVE